MPEGPSIVIVSEELARFKKQAILKVSGNSKKEINRLAGEKIIDIFSYGKYLNFQFKKFGFRIHFMLFGSYRIDQSRENINPRLHLEFKTGFVNFYNCSLQIFDEPHMSSMYDAHTDIMSKSWDKKYVLKKARSSANKTIDDLLMDQQIFTGVGNIIKNEVLFRQKLLPSQPIENLTTKQLSDLVTDARAYSLLFYEWKKAYVLKKHYQIYRKGVCPVSGDKVIHEKTGKRMRMSHYCPVCQISL